MQIFMWLFFGTFVKRLLDVIAFTRLLFVCDWNGFFALLFFFCRETHPFQDLYVIVISFSKQALSFALTLSSPFPLLTRELCSETPENFNIIGKQWLFLPCEVSFLLFIPIYKYTIRADSHPI